MDKELIMMDSIQTPQKIQIHWRDIDGWNYYFFLKFALLWAGYLNFHPLANLVFLAFLLFPLPSLFLHRCRRWIAIPLGIILFYHDTWLPNLSVLLNPETNPFAFSSNYLLELSYNFINWQLIGVAFVLLVAYLFLSQWIRLTVITVGVLCWLNSLTITGPITALTSVQSQVIIKKHPALVVDKPNAVDLNTNLPPTNENLNAYLSQFYEQQKNLRTQFPSSLPADAEHFDIILLHICSLSWSDIDTTHLRDHPLWNKFDIMFNQFNSAASYSGPAAIRLLRASCGQMPHATLYQPVPENCYLFDNLSNLGFNLQLMLDHDGSYGDFLKEIRKFGGLQQVPVLSQAGINPDLVAFNGNLILDDGQILRHWIKQTTEVKKSNGTYFNIISLHEGNTYIGNDKSAPYQEREARLLNQIGNFFTELEQAGRKTLVIFIPEHGANHEGDKIQMSGLRNIPSPNITNVPVGIKLIGMKSPLSHGQIKINEPSSYFAISELIARLIDGKVFTEKDFNLESISRNLPKTPFVSTNEGVTVMKYQDKYFILLKEDNHWVPYL